MNEKNLQLTHINDEIIVTSEGVGLQIEPLGLLMRILAFLIDFSIMLILSFMSLLSIVKFNYFFVLNEKSYQVLYILVISFFMFFLPIFIEFFTGGYSLGKYIIGARVLRDDGGVVHFRHIFTRHIIGVIEIFTLSGTLAFIVISFNKKGKRIGDYLAGTYVAKLSYYTPNLPLIMPDDFKDWAYNVTLSPIPASLLKDAKIFINRASNMNEKTRKELSEKFANELSRYVNNLPDNIHDYERFIASILVIQRDNEFRKLLRTNE